MSFLEFPIKRYQFTLVAFAMLVALGISSFSSIPRQEDPYFPIPIYQIIVAYPGAEPRDVERLVVKPIEDRISELDDIKKIESFSNDGLATILPEFYSTADAEEKYDEVVREINALRPTLPAEIARLEIKKSNPGLVNIVQFALVSPDAPYRELEDQARDLKDLLKAVDGVRTSETWAYPARELRVALDLPRMAELKLAPSRVIEALQSENTTVPGGAIDVGSRSFSVKTSGSYESLDEVRDTVVAAVDGRTVRIRDIAEVHWDTQEHTYTGRFNGQRAVFVTANQKDGYNIFEVRERVLEAAKKFEQQLPKRIKLELGFDQSENVATRLNRLTTDFAIAIALVAITLLPLGLRAASIVMISIPLSLAIGVSTLHMVGYSLNQISIAGFVVALGLLVDDSIVVVENISRFLREGHSRTEAAILATRQIFLAILGCTATIIFAFLPLMMLSGPSGKFIRVLPTAVLSTVMASLLIALTIIPFLASRILSKHENPEGNRLLQSVQRGIHRFYQPLLHRALAKPRLTVWGSLAACLVIMIGVGGIIGFSLFPKADTPNFLITVETPDGSSIAETDRALKFVENRLSAMPDVASYFTNLGHGNPKIYYNEFGNEGATNYGDIFVKLKEYDTTDTPKKLETLRRELKQYPNAHIYVKEFQNGPPITAPIAIRVIGPELDELDRLAARVEQVIKETPGTRDVENPVRIKRTDLQLKIDSQKAALFGVPAIEFDRAVRLAVAGVPASRYKETDGEQYDIMVRTPITERADIHALDQVRVTTLSGATLPLSQLAQLEFTGAPTQIDRYNRARAVTINAEVHNGYNTDRVTTEVLRRLDEMQWPRGYSYVPGGELESRAESFGGLQAATIVALLGIVAVLVLEFGSFKSTLIVLSVVPFGIAGGILALGLAGYSISFTATIGFIALIGIETKNSILLVDFTNQLRAEGVPLDEAIERAGEIRFLPILLTSATAIGGLLPLALQNAGMYSPLAWVIIGGLISSTLIARIVTPVMYKLIPPTIEVKKPAVAPATSPEAPGHISPATP
ncbi:efflux RND transporter permease subunit [Steroidobacter agaridevorans]|uniref:efflux RND transporter permease subunit n=1 Tax=Steroidobacter agaridevorans TaxID=2695856 RepID=UPI00132145A4|nr:efflux RND transporter permease subunit [Steroidobacter agaridevorans]GFE89444.1 multidrug transporter AcrB [Steroidobacter agaridevorans]